MQPGEFLSPVLAPNLLWVPLCLLVCSLLEVRRRQRQGMQTLSLPHSEGDLHLMADTAVHHPLYCQACNHALPRLPMKTLIWISLHGRFCPCLGFLHPHRHHATFHLHRQEQHHHYQLNKVLHLLPI
mmetsp:Transcript_1712/g.5967  ORF Transcript_1712/g.5967 Transcript_1712/m.5967 type:complete len:127 (-) Transcript_1712:1015-1395(-)